MKTSNAIVLAALVASLLEHTSAFTVHNDHCCHAERSTIVPWTKHSRLFMSTSSSVELKISGGFIETELRGQAMKLHTRSQAPKQGEAQEKKMEPYTPTREDYLKFLVDSQYIYQAFEDIINDREELAVFQNNGLERVTPLELDIEYLVKEYNMQRPQVGHPGLSYAEEIHRLGSQGLIPEFMCHYYNFYFAHTAGGRMIGKQMSSLLLDKKTLEFYKWDGDLNKIKDSVKNEIEEMVAQWSRDQKDRCVQETAGAFRGGGAVNSYLSGGQTPH